ncbi:hypothetical protein JZ751_012739 [Albula glossodonta]|uniref:Uncharacterized protein n=1 Tax=Albula glossodonta TaxID=121402 RepID=A0A8T2MYI6_9TELE|nr:hypothetical protein JZ751_012739 [Albula glossodonta]
MRVVGSVVASCASLGLPHYSKAESQSSDRTAVTVHGLDRSTVGETSILEEYNINWTQKLGAGISGPVRDNPDTAGRQALDPRQPSAMACDVSLSLCGSGAVFLWKLLHSAEGRVRLQLCWAWQCVIMPCLRYPG